MRIYVDNQAEAEMLICAVELLKLETLDNCTKCVCDKLVNRIRKCIELQYLNCGVKMKGGAE